MASVGDGKVSLRKFEYPMCAVEALTRLGEHKISSPLPTIVCNVYLYL